MAKKKAIKKGNVVNARKASASATKVSVTRNSGRTYKCGGKLK